MRFDCRGAQRSSPSTAARKALLDEFAVHFVVDASAARAWLSTAGVTGKAVLRWLILHIDEPFQDRIVKLNGYMVRRQRGQQRAPFAAERKNARRFASIPRDLMAQTSQRDRGDKPVPSAGVEPPGLGGLRLSAATRLLRALRR